MINEFEGMKMYDDDGSEISEYEIPKPGLCLTCAKDDNPNEFHLCQLNRFDQKDEQEFRCDAYEKHLEDYIMD